MYRYGGSIMKTLNKLEQSQLNFDNSIEGKLSKLINISDFDGSAFFSKSRREDILKAVYATGLYHPILYPYSSLGGHVVNFTTINYGV